MQDIIAENKRLKQMKQSCEDQLQKLKQVGKTHQTQIDTLLKFNERLLGIIQNEFNTATKNKISSDLQIISEINQGVNEYNNHNMIGNKLTQPPQMKGANFQEQDLQGFQDDDEEEQQIYNKQANSTPTAMQNQNFNFVKKQEKIGKLDRVYEMHHNKDEEVSINLSNSIKTNNHNDQTHALDKKKQPQRSAENQYSSDIQELKDMIKQYREQFADNSSEYEQICKAIRNDLVSDLQQLRGVRDQNRLYYQSKMKQINNLRNQVKRFKPTNELLKVMKKVNVPMGTQQLLTQKIINKHN